ncbi:MAG: ABC transporter permease subunit [Halobacteriota archaeon]
MSSRTLTIARADFGRILHDRLVWGAFALLCLLMIPTFWQSLNGSVYTTSETIGHLPMNFRLYVVILVATVALTSVVGERESGTIRLLLGLPGTRRDVVVGKLLSRCAALTITLVPIFVVLDVILLVRFGSLYLDTFAPIALWMLFYGLVWTTFTVGVSAAFTSWYRTLAAVAVTYLCLSSLVDIWSLLVVPLFVFVFTGTLSTYTGSSLGTGQEPLWYSYVGRLNPIASFVVGGDWVASVATSAGPVTQVLPNLFGIVVLLGFGAVPFLLGLRRFQVADLG